jgi:uncharacterized protein
MAGFFLEARIDDAWSPDENRRAVLNSRVWQLAGLVALAVALAFGLTRVADGIEARNANDVVSVTGSAKRRISSDYVIWDSSVSAQDASPAAAAKRLGSWAAAVRAFLVTSGVHIDELVMSPIATETVNATTADGSEGKVTGYKLTRTFEIRSSRVDAVVRVVQTSSRLVRTGIPLAAEPLQYVFTRLADLRPTLSSEATKDAIRRAQSVVDTAGGRMGRIQSIDVAPFQVTAPGSTDAGDYGGYDTSTREKDVVAVVNVTFSVN